MTPGSRPLEICAVVADAERPLLRAAASLLANALEAATGTPCRVNLTFGEAVRSDFLRPGGPGVPEEARGRGLVPPDAGSYQGSLYEPGQRLVVLSLLTDVLRPALRHRQAGYLFFPVARWEQGWAAPQRQWAAEHFVPEPPLSAEAAAGHWRAIVAEALACGATAVVVCNVFRHVAGPPGHRHYGAPESLRERIHRFNLLAAELSRQTGAYVFDLDRLLARTGARWLQTDFHLGGAAAAAAGAAELVSTLFKAGLDEYFPADVQVRAMNHFEAGLATPGWHHLVICNSVLQRMLADYEPIAPGDGTLTAESAQRLGEFFLQQGAALQLSALPGSLALRHRVLRAVADLGEGYLECARALTAQDPAAWARAVERVGRGGQQFDAFWEDFHVHFRTTTTGRAGGTADAPGTPGA
jgi:hypothetical protein